MKIGILGTGTVGKAIGDKLTELGHEVKLGGRGTFAEAARFGEIVFCCTKGEGAVPAVTEAKGELGGKVVIDVTNPLDFSGGFPPSLFVMGNDSLGEQVQRAIPDAKVVKALNTVNASVMVNPALSGGDSDIFLCGNDASAKATVDRFLRDQFGWKSVVDLGDISAARGTEAYVLFWVRAGRAIDTWHFNVKLLRPRLP